MKNLVKLLINICNTFHFICAYNYYNPYNTEFANDEGDISMSRVDFHEEVEHIFKDYTGYGTEWIFFPDGDGIPHFVNLSMPSWLQTRRGKIMDIEYRLYLRGVPDYIMLDQSAKPTEDPKIRDLLVNKPLKVVTHGWMSSAEKSVIMGIKDSYMNMTAQDVAVIGVDWSNIAMDYIYPVVADETLGVGSLVGQFLSAFCKLYDVCGDRMHLIGHSLGAHVMGIAASTSNLTIARITGLDPARPLFEFPKKSNALSLDWTDAEFVDIIHSCSGILGVQNPIGHVDFYPNSGTPPQPGCDSIFFLIEACSHGRSHIYFAESIVNPTGFPACRNINWSDYLNSNICYQPTFMGENVSHRARGQYYLKTNAKEPYARNY